MTNAVNTYSVNGNNSFRLSSPPDSIANYSAKTILETDNLNGKTVTITCDCMNLSVDNAKLQLIYGTSYKIVEIPPNSTFTTITLIQDIDTDLTEISVVWFFPTSVNDNKLYFDNIKVSVQ